VITVGIYFFAQLEPERIWGCARASAATPFVVIAVTATLTPLRPRARRLESWRKPAAGVFRVTPIIMRASSP
jgi:hypothetical protein